MLEGIPRHSGGATRVAVGTMNAGEGRNVTPAHADMQIEVRGETGPVNDWMTERVKSIVRAFRKAMKSKERWNSWARRRRWIPIRKRRMSWLRRLKHFTILA